MATKSAKTTRPVAAKKTTVKKAAVKKTVKTTPVAAAPVETHECACGSNCNCGAKCACGAHCGCGAKCACGSNCNCGAKCACGHKCGGGFGRFVKKVIIFAIIFALGFVTAQYCCCGKAGMGKMRGPRVHFVNGCVDVTSVKCPKLAAALPAMDINQDGCITKDEYRAVKKHMRREIREMQVSVEE